MKIYLGPAGVPISAKERSTIGGIKTVFELALNALECEFVRGVNMKPQLAEEIGRVAKELGVRLSVHAPYFINLNSEAKKIVEESKKRIFDTADRGERMGADAVAIHVAYYGAESPEKTFENVKNNLLDVLGQMKQNGIKNIKLGVETMGKMSQFGTIDEAVRMSKEVKGVVPYIDWAHLFVRQNGKIDYAEIFDKLEVLKLEHINSHFEGVKRNSEGRFVDVHVPICDHPPFEPLAREILKRKIGITIIAEGPTLEQESLQMKKTLEKIGWKF